MEQINWLRKPLLSDPVAIIAFEGGAKERDNIDWMIGYEKRPIRSFLLSEYSEA